MTHPTVKEKETIHSSTADLKKELVNGLFVLFRTAELYEANHPAFQKQSGHLFSLVSRLRQAEGGVIIETMDGHLFANDVRLKFDLEGYAASRFLIELFARYKMGGICFEPNLSGEELDRFIFLLRKAPEDPAELLEALAKENIQHITLKRERVAEKTVRKEKLQDSRETARKTFSMAVGLVEATMAAARAGKGFNFLSAKRVVQDLVDQVMEDEAALMELAALLHFDNYTYAHSVNVAVLSVALGSRLGLDKKMLALLGFGALFHDIGKVKLPADLVNKPAEYDEEDWKLMRRHPILGAKTLFFSRGTDEFTGRAGEVAFMHHINYDLTGYPVLKEKRVPGLFPMIVKICDSYNALSTGRVYFKTPFTPGEVVKKLIAGMGTMYDPIILKIFISTVGVFPVGSLVLLSSGEIGIVYKTNPDNIYRPRVRLIADSSGQKTGFQVVDLSERDQASGEYSRNITRLINSQEYGIDLSQFLFE